MYYLSLLKKGLLLLVCLVLLQSQANARADWQWGDPKPVGERIYSITQNDLGKAVAVGDSGLIMTRSTTGVWTVQASGTTNQLEGVTWSGTQFVAVGAVGTILTSPDGVTWTPQTSGVTGVLTNITWTGSVYIAVGTQGLIATSPDAITWTIQSSGVSEGLNAVAWNGAQFVVVGFAPYVIGAGYGAPTILTSPDGITWTAQASGLTGGSLNGVAWDGAQFAAVGFSGKIITSPDGVTWTPQTSGTTLILNDIEWSGTQWVATAINGGVLTSPDGIAWTTILLNTTATVYAVSANSTTGVYVVVGDTGLISSSTDGVTWVAESTTGSVFTSVVWGASQYVAVGGYGRIATSADGLTWVEQVSGTIQYLNDVTWDGTQFIVAGNAGTILTSTDGITWSLGNVGDTTAYLGAITTSTVGGVTQYVVLASFGKIFTSPDAVTWTAQTSATTNYIKEVIWDGAQYVAVGLSGTIMTSPDGTVWTLQTSGVTQELRSVVSNGSKLVAVGKSGTVLTSVDAGVTWVPQSLGNTGATLDISSIVWTGDTFIAVGASGAAWMSSDAITWYATTTNYLPYSITELKAAAWNGSTFAAVGYRLQSGVIVRGEILPVLAEVTAVPSLSSSATPSYTFSSDAVGTINYAGDCASATTNAVMGDNVITFNALADGLHNNCTITVTPTAGLVSAALSVPAFTTDATAPVITLVGNTPITVAQGATYNDAGATASDNVDGNISGSIVTGGTFVDTNAVGSFTITYDVSDAAGNAAAQVVRTVNVTDQTAPVITLAGQTPITVAQGATYNDAGATASDNVDGNISGSIVTGGTFVDTNAVGSFTITYDVSDAAGNAAAQVVRTVNVTDQTAPVITLAGQTPITVAQGATYNDAGATASDNVDGNISGSIVTGGTFVDTNAVGSFTITYDVSDAAGNAAAQVVRTVNVTDQTAPVITLAGQTPITVAQGATYNDAGATASDNVDGNITANINVVNNVDTAIVGNYTVTYDVSDAAGNAAVQVVRTVNVTDQTAPVIALIGNNPLNVSLNAVFSDPGATVTDNVDTGLTATVTGTVDTTVVGSYTLTYDVADTAGNAATTVTRTVNVNDPTAPVITLLGSNPITVAHGSTYVDAGSTVTDNVDTGLVAIVTGTVDTTTVGTYTLTYNVSDSAGNAATTVIRTVHVTDQTAPVIALVGNSLINIVANSSFIDPGVTVTDNVDAGLTATVTGTVNTAVVGSYILTYSVSDAAGNAAVSVIRTVNVNDPAAPAIALLGSNPITVAHGSTYVDAGSTVTDNVDTGLVAIVTGTVDTTTVGTYTLTYNVSDSAGNAAVSVTRTVHVTDQTAPVITLLGQNPVTVTQGSTYADTGVSVTDNVDTGLTATVTGTVNTAVVGTYTLTYDVTDAAGNAAAQVTRTVHVIASSSGGSGDTTEETGGTDETEQNNGTSSTGGCIAPASSSDLSSLLPMFGFLIAGLVFARRKEQE